MTGSVVVYGAYGYTGQLVARQARGRGLPVVAAGRDPQRLARVAGALGCPSRAFPLDDPEALRRGLRGAAVAVHCAGPFAATAEPVARACIAERVHYLDVTGEVPAIAALHALGPEARAAGVMLLPAAGFDVVPSDCLAAHLARRLPGARSLAVAIGGLDELSRGTARTLLAQLGAAARAGAPPPRTRAFAVGPARLKAIEAPWADVFTAPRSTGVTEVETYVLAGAAVRVAQRLLRRLAPLLDRPGLREAVARSLARGVAGPSAARRARHRTLVVCELVDPGGRRVAGLLRLPDAYAFTALVTAEIAARVLAGAAPPGWHTPSTAYGADLPLAVPGVSREEL